MKHLWYLTIRFVNWWRWIFIINSPVSRLLIAESSCSRARRVWRGWCSPSTGMVMVPLGLYPGRLLMFFQIYSKVFFTLFVFSGSTGRKFSFNCTHLVEKFSTKSSGLCTVSLRGRIRISTARFSPSSSIGPSSMVTLSPLWPRRAGLKLILVNWINLADQLTLCEYKSSFHELQPYNVVAEEFNTYALSHIL